ncbi:MAG: hypothetical protein ACR2MB_13335 [Acidimicrobiales bacterium]
MPPPPGALGPNVLVVKTRPVDALLTGIAAAALGGLAWWTVVAFTHREFPYLALVVGLLAGQGVLIGARKGGVVQGFLAALFCLAALLVAQYFVVRSITIQEAADRGISNSVPLWLGFSPARQVVTDSIRDHALTGVFFAIAVLAAAVSAGSSSQRPAVG